MFGINEDIIYKFHLFLQRYNERLLKDSLSVSLKIELQAKVISHGLKAYSIARKAV